ncbi:hypothetical protein IT568_13110 [bacterium]|nr:hypothetical protein [bacterium]
MQSLNTEKIVNLSYFKDFFTGDLQEDNEFLKTMILMLIGKNSAIVSTIKENYEKKDWDAIRTALHKFKPAVSMIGNQKLLEIIKSISDSVAGKNNLETLPNLFLEMEEICKQANKELESELKKYV